MAAQSSNQAFYCGVQCIVTQRTSPRAAPQVLLGLRVRTAGEGQWALPGGHVEWNESPIDTARRELREETGLIGRDARMGATFFTYGTEVPYAHVPVWFSSVDGSPQLMPEERFSDLRFFSLDNLPRPLFEPSRLALSEAMNAPFNPHFGGASGASFLKFDMALVSPSDGKNSAYTLLLLCDKTISTLISTWGQRHHPGRRVQTTTFSTLDEGISRFQTLVHERLRRGYYVTGVSGDLRVDRVLSLLTGFDELQVVSKSLLRRLIRDDEFRQSFMRDVFLYRAGVGLPIDPRRPNQEPLFEL